MVPVRLGWSRRRPGTVNSELQDGTGSASLTTPVSRRRPDDPPGRLGQLQADSDAGLLRLKVGVTVGYDWQSRWKTRQPEWPSGHRLAPTARVSPTEPRRGPARRRARAANSNFKLESLAPAAAAAAGGRTPCQSACNATWQSLSGGRPPGPTRLSTSGFLAGRRAGGSGNKKSVLYF